MKKRAFTLIEISIVLVIIGIILASVMKGRDLIKSSQIKEFNQVFVNQWETIANSYFSRMSAVLGDGLVNGGTTTGGGATPDGFMDATTLSTTSGVPAKAIADALLDAGIDPCTLIKTDKIVANDFGCGADSFNPFSRSVDGEFSGKKDVVIRFTNFRIDGKRKNAIAFMYIPFDVAQAIDTMRDGYANGKKGSVLALNATSATAGLPTAGSDIITGGTVVIDWNDDTAVVTGGADAGLMMRHMIILLEH